MEIRTMNPLRTRIITPRRFLRSVLISAALAIALLMLATVSTIVAAQDASPTASAPRLADLGYPELRLVATDEGAEAPREVAAGRYLVVLENRGTPGGPAAYSDVQILRLPPGVTLEDLNAVLATEGGPLPDWFGAIDSAGGIDVAAGETGYAVLDLEPGEWYVGIGDTNPFTPLTVTGDPAATPATTPDPAADVTVELRDLAVGLPDQIPAGRAVWHATNVGTQMHYLTLVKTAELLTVEQVQALASLPEGGTPPPGVPDPATVEVLPVEVRNLSPGREIWIELDLAPGHYAALCFLADPATGAPHVLLGEVAVFTVGERAA
jgi:hypothetical protein